MRAPLPTACGLAAGLASCAAPRAVHRELPNVVLIVADDLGWADLGVQGARGFETPNLDRLAREGARLTSFYVAQPVCSASRAAILTGCYPNRIGIAGALVPESKNGLAASETTIAELARERGYATAAFGKWHLGHLGPFLPTRHGFDRYYGIPYSNDMGPANVPKPDKWPDLPTYEDEHVVAYNADLAGVTGGLTERALDFVRDSAAQRRPFFLYLAHTMPHVPLATSEAFRGRASTPCGDVIEELDDGVGRLLDELERLGVAQDTLVMFTSDNGPWLPYGDHAGSAGPLREGKGTTFEGGVRVPFVARWPGHVPAGLVSDEPVMTIDLLPTLAHWIGAPLPQLTIDGLDVAPLLEGRSGAHSPHEALFFWYASGELQALRCGPWKLHFPHGYVSMEGVEPGRGGHPGSERSLETGLELYDLSSDIGEEREVAAEHPDVVARLEALADAMRARLGDSRTKVTGSEVRPSGRVGD